MIANHTFVRTATRCACGCKRRLDDRAPNLAGRPRRYWSNTCRDRAYRARRRASRSLSVDWYTPVDVFEEGLALLGVDRFDLDPCTNPRSPIWPLVEHHYTVDDDGLARPWFGRVWVNPPYGRSIPAWIRKAVAEIASSRVDALLLLVPAKTDTGWWHQAVDAGLNPTMRRGRVRFWEPQPDGTLARPRGSGKFPSAWLAFRKQPLLAKSVAP